MVTRRVRIFAIIQLCLAFSVIGWTLSDPWTGSYFVTRSELLLFQAVTGKGDRFLPADKLARHAERFAALTPARQENILRAYGNLEQRMQRPFLAKIKASFENLIWGLSPYTQMWIVFSLVISLMLLLHIDGAVAASWLLPLLAICYAVDNRVHGAMQPPSIDERILPSEVYLQRYDSEDVVRAWQLYLIQEWAREEPDPARFPEQVEQGEHALTLARVEARIEQTPFIGRTAYQPLFLLVLYILWNSLFVWGVSRNQMKRPFATLTQGIKPQR